MDMIFDYLQDAMTNLVVAAICATIALAALAGVAISLLGKRSLTCMWREDALQPHAGKTRWQCKGCGAFGFGQGGRPPLSCRRYEPKQGL